MKTSFDEAMDNAIRHRIPTAAEDYAAIARRAEVNIAAIFTAEAFERRRVARELREFLEQHPPHGKLRPGQR